MTNLPHRIETASADARSKGPGMTTDDDRRAADKAFDIAFRGETEGIDAAMAALFAAHRLASERRALERAADPALIQAAIEGLPYRWTYGDYDDETDAETYPTLRQFYENTYQGEYAGELFKEVSEDVAAAIRATIGMHEIIDLLAGDAPARAD